MPAYTERFKVYEWRFSLDTRVAKKCQRKDQSRKSVIYLRSMYYDTIKSLYAERCSIVARLQMIKKETEIKGTINK